MVANQHFQRLKHIYASDPAGPAGDRVAISYGRAELDGMIDAAQSTAVGDQLPHHRLLSDAATLAAGSLEKEHVVTAEQFAVDVVNPDYEGPVVASAEVALAEPPRTVVQAVLVDEDGELVAEAKGVFRPSENHLPPDPAPEEKNETDDAPTPPPASFMPVHTTPYGYVCLN
jgi:hypothetical protein